MILEAIIRIRKLPERPCIVALDVPELRDFVLAAHVRIDEREKHWLHGDDGFWQPVAALQALTPSFLRRVGAVESGDGLEYPVLHDAAADAILYDDAGHDAETREAIENLRMRVEQLARIAGGNLYKRVAEPTLSLGIDQGNFLGVRVGSDPFPHDGPNGCRFSLRELDLVQELRRRLKPKGTLPAMPGMLSPPAPVLMDSVASEQMFVETTRHWLAKEAKGHRTGMLPVPVMRRLRHFLLDNPANGLALGALLKVLEDGEVRARRRTENDTWFDGTAASLSKALLLSRRRCEMMHPHLLADVEADLADLLL